MTDETPDLMEMTADIVSAYVAANALASADLAAFIGKVHGALARIADGETAAPPSAPLKPAVSIRRSITPDHLISLEDGRSYRMLKRHLAKLGLTPEAYRNKWGLPKDYPMVAPTHAAARSALAKSLGLGRRPDTVTPIGKAAKTTARAASPAKAGPSAKGAKAGATKAAVPVPAPKRRGRAPTSV
jgi:predicted transcriptional regulator